MDWPLVVALALLVVVVSSHLRIRRRVNELEWAVTCLLDGMERLKASRTPSDPDSGDEEA